MHDAAKGSSDPLTLDLLDPVPRSGGIGFSLGDNVEARVHQSLDRALHPAPIHLLVSRLVEEMQGHLLLGWVQGRAPEHVANEANDTSKLLWVGERSIESDAAALRGSADDDPLGVAANTLHLAADERVQPRAHVQ